MPLHSGCRNVPRTCRPGSSRSRAAERSAVGDDASPSGGWRRRQSERRSWDRLAATHDPGRDVDQLIDLRVALASLSPRQLEVVQLYYFLGLAVAETAGQLGISEGTVKKALSRARETLRRALEITP